MLMEDRVTLVKGDGTEIPNILADVQPKMVFIDDESLPIQEGDRITRTLPNGRSESYLVLEAEYWGKHGGWQIQVRKESAISRNPPAPHIHQYGHGSRVNIDSQDYSTNIVNADDVFKKLRGTIESAIAKGSKRREILNRLTALESARGTQSYVTKYQEFIQAAANHMTILAPFIPALTQLFRPT